MEKLDVETLKSMILSEEESKIGQALNISRNKGLNLDSFYKSLSALKSFYEEQKRKVYTFENLYKELKQEGLNLPNLNLEHLPAFILEFSDIIEKVDISNNSFFEFPALLLSCKKISELNISNNRIRNLDPEFFEFRNLKTLNLSDNLILKLPENILKLTELKSLSISCRNPEFFPAEFCHSKLYRLELDFEKTFAVPDFIFDIKTLKELKLEGISELPESISEACGLEKLSISRSGIENLPDKLADLKSLKTLELTDLKLMSKVPEVIFQLESLEKLVFNNSAINELPSSLRRLKNLKTIKIEGCTDTETRAHWEKRILCWGKSFE